MIEQALARKRENRVAAILGAVFALYRDGFRSMVLGRTLWKIIIIKLLIMFGVLKLFFFPNYLNSTYETEAEKAAHVLGELSGDRGQPSPVPLNQPALGLPAVTRR